MSDHYVYTNEEYDQMQQEEADHAAYSAAWQFDEEVKYQTALAISYPRDTQATFALNWLKEIGAWA